MSKIMDTKKYFLQLVSSSIQGLPVSACPDEIDVEKIYKLSIRNAVTNILYNAVKNGTITLPSEIENKLQKLYMTNLAREVNQQTEIELIREEFANQNIKFMFLKGTHLKSLYPQPEMRFMVDMDILIKEQDMAKGEKIILGHGFRKEVTTEKDIILIKEPFLTIELHKKLFAEEYFMNDYFDKVWDKAESITDSEYKMSNNDLYVYTLAHLCEHYLSAGSCFRPLMDLFLMEKNFDNLDFDYINKQFEELEIESFAKKIRQLYKCIFENGEYNDDLIVMEDYILFGAPISNAKESSRIARTEKTKLQRIVEITFPNLKHMQIKYPILKKAPILLPIYYVIRFFEYIFFKKRFLKNKGREIATIDDKNTNIMKNIFEKSGL